MPVRWISCWMLAVCLMMAMGCSRAPGRLSPPAINAAAAGAKAIEMYDTNGDGKLSDAELDKCPALKSAMARIDTTGEGAITAAMIAARIQHWQVSKVGRMPMTCIVLHNGRPLPDADVKFVPEKFLGDDIKAVTGKTDENGMATISVPTTGPKDPRGAAPGLYRVEVTKEGGNIPSKYNTDTILGREISTDFKDAMGGIKIDLKY